mgnify:CR=1 FL=1
MPGANRAKVMKSCGSKLLMRWAGGIFRAKTAASVTSTSPTSNM